jgi:predicted nuclease with TOPRIM domain
MSVAFAPLLPALLAAEPGSGSSTGMVLTLLLIAVAASFVAIVTVTRLRAVQRELSKVRKESAEAQETAKGLHARERDLQKRLDERHEELRDVKQDLAGLRKKHHTSQEESKGLREQLRVKTDERDRATHSRPAFETTPSAPAAKPKPVVKEEVKETKPADAPAVEKVAAEVNGRLEKLEAEHQELMAELDSERQRARTQKAELHKLRTFTEQLRRIDLISKGKVEVLEDKVAGLGRQYYEAVSELAAVKGEVVPPSPRQKGDGARKERRKQDAEPDDQRPESDALAEQMAAAEAEAGDSLAEHEPVSAE